MYCSLYQLSQERLLYIFSPHLPFVTTQCYCVISQKLSVQRIAYYKLYFLNLTNFNNILTFEYYSFYFNILLVLLANNCVLLDRCSSKYKKNLLGSCDSKCLIQEAGVMYVYKNLSYRKRNCPAIAFKEEKNPLL